jgi:hypothetical protein
MPHLAFIPLVLTTIQQYTCASAIGVVRTHAPVTAKARQSGDAAIAWWPFNEPEVRKEPQSSPQGGTNYIPLKNMGTHSEVEVTVGTAIGNAKPQVFSIIADTGSNNVIVPSCACQQQGGACSSATACFTGTDHSSSFILVEGNETDGSLIRTLSFGSGDVDAVVAHDVVKLGHVEHNTKGLLLMVNNQLDFEISGILGLGVPGSNERMAMEERRIEKAMAIGDYETATAPMKDMVREIDGVHDIPKGEAFQFPRVSAEVSALGKLVPMASRSTTKGHNILDAIMKAQARHKRTEGTESAKNVTKNEEEAELYPGFLEQASVAQFSMCFNQNADGWLGLSKEETPRHHDDNSLLGFGTAHWGVGLSGVSFRSARASKSASESLAGDIPTAKKNSDAAPSVVIAKEQPPQSEMIDALGGLCVSKESGQLTACGALIDSGTTEILAPQNHVDLLLNGICHNWERCSNEVQRLREDKKTAMNAERSFQGSDAFQSEIAEVSTQDTLKILLADCASWADDSSLAEGNPFAELPTLVFHLCGRDGKCKDIEIPGHQYIIQRDYSEFSDSLSGQVSEPATYLKTWLGDPTQYASIANYQHMLNALLNGASHACSPAFDTMDLSTAKNGPSWILGTAVFYEYNVGYGMKDNSISFTSAKERPCTGSDSKAKDQLIQKSSLQPRRIRGPLRKPSFA